MLKLFYKKINLPFRHPFTISKGTKTHQPSLVVVLESFGQRGYGEAPAIAYYDITVEQMIADLEAKKNLVEKFSFSDPERYWHYLHHLFPQNPFLVCALDIAAWDLFGKHRRQPLWKLWGLDAAQTPPTDFTIGIDSPEKMVFKMQERPWDIYKIKVGVPGDIELVQELRKNTQAKFRVDANAGWTLEEALEKIPQLQALGVEFVEQPLAKDNFVEMKTLKGASPLPLMADESCVSEQDVERCEGSFHGINIKLTKCSGITPARRMITDARSRGLKVMIGTMNECTIGSAAIAHLSPLIDYLDMDGPLLLAEDVATGVIFKDQMPELNNEPGLGISVNENIFNA